MPVRSPDALVAVSALGGSVSVPVAPGGKLRAVPLPARCGVSCLQVMGWTACGVLIICGGLPVCLPVGVPCVLYLGYGVAEEKNLAESLMLGCAR